MGGVACIPRIPRRFSAGATTAGPGMTHVSLGVSRLPGQPRTPSSSPLLFPAFMPHSDGPLSFKKIHDIVPSWMIDIKTKNLGRSDGVACSMVDVFYVPGTLAEPFGWLAILTARTGTEVRSCFSAVAGAPAVSTLFMAFAGRAGAGDDVGYGRAALRARVPPERLSRRQGRGRARVQPKTTRLGPQ